MLILKQSQIEGKNLSYACGMGEDALIPGYMGLEMGQTAFGDLYAWFNNFMMWSYSLLEDKENLPKSLLDELSKQASELPIQENLISLDWFNGRRYPYANEDVRGVIAGLTIGTTPPQLFQSLVLATVFGWKRIIDALISEGVTINKIIAVGGIAHKSPYIIQTMANVSQCEISVSGATQACATGSAIYAAVACGAYKSIQDAQKDICPGYTKVYYPQKENEQAYKNAFAKYCSLSEQLEEWYKK